MCIKNVVRRSGAFLSALVLCFVLAVPAWAADDISADDFTIVVNSARDPVWLSNKASTGVSGDWCFDFFSSDYDLVYWGISPDSYYRLWTGSYSFRNTCFACSSWESSYSPLVYCLPGTQFVFMTLDAPFADSRGVSFRYALCLKLCSIDGDVYYVSVEYDADFEPISNSITVFDSSFSVVESPPYDLMSSIHARSATYNGFTAFGLTGTLERYYVVDAAMCTVSSSVPADSSGNLEITIPLNSNSSGISFVFAVKNQNSSSSSSSSATDLTTVLAALADVRAEQKTQTSLLQQIKDFLTGQTDKNSAYTDELEDSTGVSKDSIKDKKTDIEAFNNQGYGITEEGQAGLEAVIPLITSFGFIFDILSIFIGLGVLGIIIKRGMS